MRKSLKKLGVENTVSLIDLYNGLDYFGDEPIDVDRAIKRAKDRGKPLGKEQINRLKE